MFNIFKKKWDCITRVINLELKVESLSKENEEFKTLLLELTAEIARLSVQVKHVVELSEKHKTL
jgi:hypothetical protein